MTTPEQRKDIAERMREFADRADVGANHWKAAMVREAADEIDILRSHIQFLTEERDAARAEVQCLRAELKETV